MNGYKNYIITALLAFLFGVAGTQLMNHIAFEHRVTSLEQVSGEIQRSNDREHAELRQDIADLTSLATRVLEQNNKLIAKLESR